jgi:tetratricopeptide (TPR) repeat protein
MVKISIAADSLNSSYLDTIGWVYYKLGNYKLAKYYIQKSIDNGGGNAEVLEHLGDTEFKLGNIEQAKVLWKKALAIDNSNTKLKTKIETGVI